MLTHSESLTHGGGGTRRAVALERSEMKKDGNEARKNSAKQHWFGRFYS